MGSSYIGFCGDAAQIGTGQHAPHWPCGDTVQLHAGLMAQTASFDVTTGVDLQEVDNAINQAQKEVAQRYDFKGSKASIDFTRAENLIALVADSDFQMTALFDIVQTKLIKRGVPVKNLDIGELKQAGGDTVRRDVKLKMELDSDTAKKVAAAIKDAKLKKVQASIQGEQVRVSGPSRDDLQEAMTLLKSKDFGVQLQFGNYR
jgi:uncharacterized protein YajQ (UPF0234 family)